MNEYHPVTKEHCNHECVCPDYKAAHSENGEEECYGDPEPCKLSCYHRSRPLSEHDAEIRMKERERVLKGILMAMNDPQLSICDTGYLEHAYWRDYIKSLRGEP